MSTEALPQNVTEAVQAITEVREQISWNAYTDPKKISPARFWTGTGLDALILSGPDHNGRPEDVAREVYHRLSARLIGTYIHDQQRAALKHGIRLTLAGSLLFILAFIFFPIVAAMISPDLLSAVPWIMVGLYFGIPIWLYYNAKSVFEDAHLKMREIPIAALKEEALGAVQRCFVRAVPPDTPADLTDVWRHGWLTNEGRPVSSEIVDTDATSVAAIEVAQDWRSVYQALIFCALLTLVAPCAFLFMFVLAFALSQRLGDNPGVIRARELDRRQAVEGSTLTAAGGIEWSKHQEQARIQQIVEARADKTPVFRFGAATGILAGRGDSYAPSQGVPFDLSLRDLQNHMLVLGGTGSGKTSGVLRPLAWQLAHAKQVGMVVMDGKAALPAEFIDMPGMEIVDPARSKFSLVSGLSPMELVDTLVDVLSSGSESDPYWKNSAAGLLRRAAVLASFAKGEWWTLQGIARIASEPEAIDEVKKIVTVEIALEHPQLAEAFMFFAYEWAAMDAKPKSSVLSHAMTWISTITAHPELLSWAELEEGNDTFDLTAPLKGGRMGFLIPAHRYGHAGAAVTALLKARIYAGLKSRAERKLSDGETPVVFIIDEVQEVATRDDATMLSIGRSLGLAMVGATQTVEGVTEKLGDKTAAKWLAVFGNAIALTNRSSATDEFMAKRTGSSWKAAVHSVPGISVKDAIASSVFSGSSAVGRKQPTMRNFAVLPPSPTAPFVQRSKQSSQQQGGNANPDPRLQREPDEGLSSTVQPGPIVYAEELPTLLAEPNLALAVTIRARVPRRDVIKLDPKF